MEKERFMSKMRIKVIIENLFVGFKNEKIGNNYNTNKQRKQ